MIMTSDVQIIVMETVEEFCNKFCKFSNTGSENQCAWCQMHDGECPFDKLLGEVGLK